MKRQWEAIRGSVGFYVTLAVCLVVVGVGGYLWLSDGATEEATELPASAPVADLATEPEVPASSEEDAAETSAHAVVQTITMPEAEVSDAPVSVDDTPVAVEAPRIIVTPLQGDVLTAFSVDALVYDPTMADWRTHDGLDIAAEAGAPVLAACSGTVASVTEDALMGATVVLQHDGNCQTTYACLAASPTVSEGDAVSAGQIIGAVGDTAAAESAHGPHLHFSVSQDGDALDPQTFLDG